MKLDPRKTGIDNLLALIRKDNPEADIKAEQITVGELVDNASMRTVTTITAKLDRGYSGYTEIDYLRRRLEEFLSDGQHIYLDDGGDTEEEFKQKIADSVGVIWTELDWGDITIPRSNANQLVFITVSTDSNIVYRDSDEKDIVVSTVDLDNARGLDQDTIRVTDTGCVRFVVPPHQKVGIYYGGTNGSDSTLGVVTLIDDAGTPVGSESTIDRARRHSAGAKINHAGMFYGNYSSTNEFIKINSHGVKVFDNVFTGTSRTGSCGMGLDSLAMYYGGQSLIQSYSNALTRVNGTGNILSYETQVGTGRYDAAAVGIDTKGIVLGGIYDDAIDYSIISILTTDGTLSLQEGVIQPLRSGLAGCRYDLGAAFFAGGDTNLWQFVGIDSAVIGIEETVGTGRSYLAGANASMTGIFYGGQIDTTTYSSEVTRLSPSGTVIATETTVGTPRSKLAGC